MFQHSASALMVAEGERPSLSMNGTERAVAKQVLDAHQAAGLLAEIAPAESQSAIRSGLGTSFVYSGAGDPVQVEISPGPKAVLKPMPTRTADLPVEPAVPAPVDPPVAAPVDPSGAEPVDAPVAAPVDAAVAAPVDPQIAEGPLMERLFRDLVKLGGSDLHLSTESQPMMRVDGDLKEFEGYDALDAETTLRVLLEIAPERNAEEFKETGDTDFAYEIEGLGRFRCNLFQDLKGPGGVYRIIPTDIRSASELGLSNEICQLANLTKGLVLVTGPTGSGKSTTLATLIDLVNSSRHDHIITIEDPIEFVHPNKKCLVNQREVHIHTSGFKRALRAALREDPDVILIGELRDLETIAMAIETAETGHLVFGTLHTTSAVSTVDRMIDQFPAHQQEQIRAMLAASLKAVVAQVLCKKIGGGRVPALEVLIVNSAVSNLIRERKTFQIPSIMQTGKKNGMVQLNDALLELVTKGVVEPREAYLKAIDKTVLVGMFQANQIPTNFL